MVDKILILDSDTSLLRYVAEYIEARSFEAIRATTTSDALRLLMREKPDLMVMDIEVNDMPGWTPLARVREATDIPLILLTAKSSEADKLRGFSMGADDYVTKPFSFAELTARIQAVLKRSRKTVRESKRDVRFGETHLDFRKREARRKGEIIPLTPTEFRLLEALANREGDAVSENELIREVWDEFRQEETAAVRRYIWMLRQKFEENPSEPQWILTVRGYGYRLLIDNSSQEEDLSD
jgi:two-component system KDP operon response regulator KdpE